MTPAMVFERHGAFAVVCHTDQAPSYDEWDAYLDFALTGVQAGRLQGFLIVSQGGGPNAMQRRQLEMQMRTNGFSIVPPAAMVTDAWLARQIAMIVSWFSPTVAVFSGNEFDRAMDYLRVPAAARPDLMAVAVRLQERLAVVAQSS